MLISKKLYSKFHRERCKSIIFKNGQYWIVRIILLHKVAQGCYVIIIKLVYIPTQIADKVHQNHSIRQYIFRLLQLLSRYCLYLNLVKVESNTRYYTVYVHCVCILCMYVHCICTLCMYTVYVHRVCMYTVYVCTLRMYVHCVCMYTVYVYCVCMYTVYVCTLCMYTVYVCTLCMYVHCVCIKHSLNVENY